MSYEVRNAYYPVHTGDKLNEGIAFASALRATKECSSQLDVVLHCCNQFVNIEEGKVTFDYTPEWQRIQEQLSKVEQLEKENKQLRTNFKNSTDAAKIVCSQLEALEQEHESLLSRLPKNADGDLVLWDDEQLSKEVDTEGAPYNGPVQVKCIALEDDGTFSFFVKSIYDSEAFDTAATNLYSIHESCQSAQTEGEGA